LGPPIFYFGFSLWLQDQIRFPLSPFLRRDSPMSSWTSAGRLPVSFTFFQPLPDYLKFFFPPSPPVAPPSTDLVSGSTRVHETPRAPSLLFVAPSVHFVRSRHGTIPSSFPPCFAWCFVSQVSVQFGGFFAAFFPRSPHLLGNLVLMALEGCEGFFLFCRYLI